MNKKLGLAVAGALVAFSSAANAGITIPAGDWTLDVGGVVNAYYTTTRHSGDNIAGGAGALGGTNANSDSTTNNITTGLLPNYLSVSGKSRQNDLDIGFTISINPGASTVRAGIQTSAQANTNQENRQAFLTIGDASWGSVKLGKDLGVFASDAILNDMTLLGVGSGAGFLAGNTTTLGRIGTGFVYADWKAQVAYTTPNWNGFQATVAATQAFNALDIATADADAYGRKGSAPAMEAKASYSWTGDVAGKVWASALSQKLELSSGAGSERANAWDLGTNINVAGLGLTGYYYDGKGLGTTVQFLGALDNNAKRRDSKGGYVQATYALPTATKIGVSYGKSTLEKNSGETALAHDLENSMWTVGAYHPLTKSVNLVAEYSRAKTELGNEESRAKTVSLGAILFF
jgi:predicted porin